MDEELTEVERKAIASLKRLAKTWPRTLTLASMGGALVIVRTGDKRFSSDETFDRQESVIDDIHGIPNTGGDW